MDKQSLKKSKWSGIVRGIVGKYKEFKFPSNYRIITVIVLSLVLIALISLISLDFYKNFGEKQRVGEERQKLVSEILFWQGIIAKHKDYRDAYFKLASLEYQLKNFNQARKYLQKVLEIDPNFEVGRRLEKLLNIQPAVDQP